MLPRALSTSPSASKARARGNRPAHAEEVDALVRLARARRVATRYLDANGERQQASIPALIGVLAALGEPVERLSDAPAALRRRAEARRLRRGDTKAVPPVIVAWDGLLPAGSRPEGSSRLVLRGETVEEGAVEEGPDWLDPAAPLPLGYYRLADASGVTLAHVIAAPSQPPREPGREIPAGGGWALFAPTYALVDDRERPAGDLRALDELGELAAAHGACAIATLPLLAEAATADGAPAGQQPYAPLSRMWWNEALVDLAQLEELAPEDREALDVAGLGPALARRDEDGRALADLAGLASAMRPALERAMARLEAGDSPRRRAFVAFRRLVPDLDRYASFRAAMEQAGSDLARWPSPWRAGRFAPGDLDPKALARHAYAQFAIADQLRVLTARAHARGCGLLLDLPVGCGPSGYDPWAHPEAFASGASIGAPPDAFFRAGQNWGFPPPDPEVDRAGGYRLLRRVLAHHMQHASWLRIDHALGWWRLWWVPKGHGAADGAYVRYPTEELLAVACLEAARAGTRLVAEDLGTVPRGLRPALRRRGVDRMAVAVFDLGSTPGRRLRPRAGTVAYVDTHDTATFAGFVHGLDIELRALLGVTSPSSARHEAAARRQVVARLVERLAHAELLAPGEQGDALGLLRAVLIELGSSSAELVVVALEDLIAEREPQNVPGTTVERANFARRVARPLTSIEADSKVRELLAALDTARRGAPQPPLSEKGGRS